MAIRFLVVRYPRARAFAACTMLLRPSIRPVFRRVRYQLTIPSQWSQIV